MNLYDYQIEAVDATDTNEKGILVLPTGTGKTMIQSAVIERDILTFPNQFRMYVVNAPRIILTYQLLREVYNFMVSRGIECRYHFTHSGSAIDERDLENMRIEANLDGHNIPFSDIDSSTSSIRLTDTINKCLELNIPLIVFSTYNSAERIEESRLHTDTKISIVLNDEAHYLVQERFNPILDRLPSDRTYFFTATTRHTSSDEGRGMNNINSYGDVIYRLLPREAIERGKMVRPRIHTIKTEGVRTSEDYDRSFNQVILNSFNQHKEHLNNNHTQIAPKILISTRGANDIKNFLLSDECGVLRNSGVDVFAISSNQEVGNDVNGVKVKRQEFLKLLREYGKNVNKEMLILHFDILTEGIDVPGITTIMPLRELNKSRFIQTYGRCARVDVRDRVRIDSGEISPNDLDSMVKPYAYVILPYLTQTNKDDSDSMRNIIYELRQFGFNPSEDVVGEVEARGISEEEGLDTFNMVNRRNGSTGNIINEVLSEFELEEICSLTELEQMDRHIEGEIDLINL
jgi:superfamily II DNA or RNA helicase